MATFTTYKYVILLKRVETRAFAARYISGGGKNSASLGVRFTVAQERPCKV